MSRNIYFAFLALFLTVASFTGCGKNETNSHAAGNATAKGATSGEMTVILPGNVTLPMVKIEAGTFEMSAKDGENTDDEVPHRATLTRDFYLGKTEVTLAQWKAVMETNPSEYKDDDLPVEYVSWNDAMEFCGKLNDLGKPPKGWMFTLPTETQWEYAARGGNRSKGYKYSGSDNVDDVAWYEDNAGWAVSGDVMSPVGRKKPNELGLYDMSGNVYEWCLDDWQDKSDMLTPEFTRGNDSGGSERAIRGGSWNNPARTCRSAERNGGEPDDRNGDFGFRLALVPTKMLLVLKGIHYRNVIKNNSKDGMILVTSWAKDQVTPDLQHGRWVMIGKATKLNYFAAGCPAGLFKHDNYITGYVEIERLKGVPYLYKTDKGWSADIPFLKHDLFNQWTLR